MDQYGPWHSLAFELRLTSVISTHRGEARDLPTSAMRISGMHQEGVHSSKSLSQVGTRCNSPEQESVAAATENVSSGDDNLGMHER